MTIILVQLLIQSVQTPWMNFNSHFIARPSVKRPDFILGRLGQEGDLCDFSLGLRSVSGIFCAFSLGLLSVLGIFCAFFLGLLSVC